MSKLPIFKSVPEVMAYIHNNNIPQEKVPDYMARILPDNPKEDLLRYMLSLLDTSEHMPDSAKEKYLKKLANRIDRRLRGVVKKEKKLVIMQELVKEFTVETILERDKYKEGNSEGWKSTKEHVTTICEKVLRESSELTEEQKTERLALLKERYRNCTDEFLDIVRLKKFIAGICEVGLLNTRENEYQLILYIIPKDIKNVEPELDLPTGPSLPKGYGVLNLSEDVKNYIKRSENNNVEDIKK